MPAPIDDPPRCDECGWFRVHAYSCSRRDQRNDVPADDPHESECPECQRLLDKWTRHPPRWWADAPF